MYQVRMYRAAAAWAYGHRDMGIWACMGMYGHAWAGTCRSDSSETSTDRKSKSSLGKPNFPIGESLIFNQLRRPTRTKASDNREPRLAAIPSADGHILHVAVLAMMSDTRFSGWLLRFFFFGAKN